MCRADGQVANLSKVVRMGLLNKATLEHRLEGGEKSIGWRAGTGKCPEWGVCLVCSRRSDEALGLEQSLCAHV